MVNDFALSQAENGDYLQAIALLNQVITSEEGLKVHYDQTVSFQFYLNRGDCHRQLEDYKCAIADYNMAASLQPNNWEIKTRLSMANYSAAVAYFNEGYYKDSEGLLDDAIRLNFKIFEYFLLRGRSRYYQGDFEGARSDYLAAYRLNPNGVEVQRYYFQFHTGSTNDVNGPQVSSSIQSSLTLIPPKQDIPFNIHMKPAVSKIKDECSRERGVAIPSTPSILQPQDQLQLLRTLPSLHTRLYNSSSLPSHKRRSNEQALKGPSTFDSRNQERSSWQGKTGAYTSAFKLKEESKRRTQLSLRRPDALLVGVASLPQKRF